MIQVIDNLGVKLKLGIGLRINELKEVLRRKRQELTETKAAHKKKKFPVHYTQEETVSISEAGRKRYLQYCLSLIAERHPHHHNLLVLLLTGWTHKKIAEEMNKQGFNYSVAMVHKKEAEALAIVSQTITELRKKGVPIFSELPAQEPGLPRTSAAQTGIAGLPRVSRA